MTPPSTGEKIRKKGKREKPSRPLSDAATIALTNAETALRRVKEQAEIARKERKEATRGQAGEEASKKAQQEAVRLAQEHVTATQRELQSQREQEQAEVKERERVAKRRKQEEKWAKDSVVTIQQFVLNSFVKFGAGLVVQHVICGFGASSIHVKNLPMDAKSTEILDLFVQQGIKQEDLALLRIEDINGCQQATVLGNVADVNPAAVRLNGIEFRDRNLEFVVREHASEGRTMGASNRNSYHLTISWRPAFLTMIARYSDLERWEIAQKARELDQGFLDGQHIRAELDWERECDAYDPCQPSIHRPRVKISRISSATTIQMVKNFTGTQNIEIYKDPFSYTSDDVFSALHSHIRSLPNSTLRVFTFENVLRPNAVSAKAVFGTYEGAQMAYDSLKGKVFGRFFPSLRIFLSDPYRFIITLDEKQYISQRNQWIDLCENRGRDANVQVRTIDKVGGRKVIISLIGRDKQAVGALKVRIENLASGQRLDAAHWHPNFKSSKGQDFLNSLYERTGVYVRIDQKRGCVVIFGRSDMIEDAKSHIKEEVKRISSEQTILLQRRAVGFFIKEGLAQMRALLGEENVTLDAKSSMMVLRGTDLEEAKHHLSRLMNNFLDHNSGLTVTSDDTLCPICYDTASQPIEINCKHIYCSSCLRHYILSTLDNHSFPLKCMGDDATCNHHFSLPLIRKFLPPQRFEQLITAAFTSYLDKNQETFKYCITPDCSQIYRATVLPYELQCPSCFLEICTACHTEGHAGMSCAEKRQHKNLEEQERLLRTWAGENNVKQCPSCRVWVEKVEGCHHISCKCGVHFCWICAGVFDANRIYTHMTEVHGDWYNDPEHGRRQAATGGQPRVQVPNIVQIAGGQAAVAEQAVELRRLEFLPENRAARPVIPRPPRAVPQPPRAVPQPAHPAAQLARIGIYEGQQRHLQPEADERRRALERFAEVRRQQQALEEQRRHEAREAAERQRSAEENKWWCIVM